MFGIWKKGGAFPLCTLITPSGDVIMQTRDSVVKAAGSDMLGELQSGAGTQALSRDRRPWWCMVMHHVVLFALCTVPRFSSTFYSHVSCFIPSIW